MTRCVCFLSSLRTARALPEAGSNRSVAELNGVNPDIDHCFIFIINLWFASSLFGQNIFCPYR
ncbi:MAG: hypothetical protein LBP85_10215 [Prevotellaceae bacterium]|nr:hypothetical protein [Prevotellaceae bacterium]